MTGTWRATWQMHFKVDIVVNTMAVGVSGAGRSATAEKKNISRASHEISSAFVAWVLLSQ